MLILFLSKGNPIKDAYFQQNKNTHRSEYMQAERTSTALGDVMGILWPGPALSHISNLACDSTGQADSHGAG